MLNMMSDSQTRIPIYKPYIEAHCPSCGHVSHFTYNGAQHWPKEIAEKVGMPEVVHLWSCGHCGSTISETELR